MKTKSIKRAAGIVLLSAAITSPAFAEGLSGTAAATTNYLFRGVSQTSDQPTVQASIGYDFGSGFSVGAWGSGLDFHDFGDNKSTLETDYYANYATKLGKADFTVGAIYYAYPTSASAANYNYIEATVGLRYDFGPAAVHGAVFVSPEFTGKTGNSAYLTAGVDVPINSWLSAAGNYSYQTIQKGTDYSNWNLGLTATYEKYSLNVMYSQTDLAAPYNHAKIVATLSAAF